METVEISKREHEMYVAAEAERDELRTKLAEAEQKIEAAEAAKATVETERDSVKADLQKVTEERDTAKLKDDRLAALGTGFRAKLDKLETTKARVEAQAATLKDEEWEARVTELEETLSVKRDAKADGEKDDPAPGEKKDGEEFKAGDVTASLAALNSNSGGGGNDRAQVRSVVGSLAKSFSGPPAGAAK